MLPASLTLFISIWMLITMNSLACQQKEIVFGCWETICMVVGRLSYVNIGVSFLSYRSWAHFHIIAHMVLTTAYYYMKLKHFYNPFLTCCELTNTSCFDLCLSDERILLRRQNTRQETTILSNRREAWYVVQPGACMGNKGCWVQHITSSSCCYRPGPSITRPFHPLSQICSLQAR